MIDGIVKLNVNVMESNLSENVKVKPFIKRELVDALFDKFVESAMKGYSVSKHDEYSNIHTISGYFMSREGLSNLLMHVESKIRMGLPIVL